MLYPEIRFIYCNSSKLRKRYMLIIYILKLSLKLINAETRNKIEKYKNFQILNRRL